MRLGNNPVFLMIFVGLVFGLLSCAELPTIAVIQDETPLPRALDPEVLGQIKKGMTTQRDVMDLLGKPKEKGMSQTDQGKEEFWVYMYSHLQGESFIQNEGARDILRITFREKVVHEWEHTRFLPGGKLAGSNKAGGRRFDVITDVIKQKDSPREQNIWLKGIMTDQIERDIPIRRSYGFTRGKVLMQSFSLSDGANSILVFRFYNERRKIKFKSGNKIALVTGRYCPKRFDHPVMISWDELMGPVNVNEPWLITFVNQQLSKPSYQTAVKKSAQFTPKPTYETIDPLPSEDLTLSSRKNTTAKKSPRKQPDPLQKNEATFQPTLSIIPVSGKKDEVVTVSVSLNDTPRKIEAFGLRINFDARVLKYLSVEPGELTKDWSSLNARLGPEGKIVAGGYNLNPIPPGSKGVILNINFKVVCSFCRNGHESSITFSALKDDIKGWKTQGGTFTFIAYTRDGDVNGDNSITPADALLAFKHYLGLIQLSDQSLFRGDRNGDGEITPADARSIFKQYLNNL